MFFIMVGGKGDAMFIWQSVHTVAKHTLGYKTAGKGCAVEMAENKLKWVV